MVACFCLKSGYVAWACDRDVHQRCEERERRGGEQWRDEADLEQQRAGERSGEHRQDGGDPARRALPEPPATRESAARPVRVIVSTVVVRSGTASRLTVALRTPMASASRAMTASPAKVLGRTSAAAATIAAARISAISIPSARATCWA